MRQRLTFYLAAIVGLAGCAGSEISQTPTDPNASDAGRPQFASQVPNPYCAPVTSADIESALHDLFVKNAWPDENSTKGKFKDVEDLLDAGDVDGARAATQLLVAFIANKFGHLTPAEQDASQDLYDAVVNQLWCFVGISGLVFDLNPGDTAKAFDIDGVGGVLFPADVVPVGTIVSLTDLSGGQCPLNTTLDCFPGYLDISLYPNATLSQLATVVLCPPATAPTSLAVGHQTAAGFELLPVVAVPPALANTCTTPVSQRAEPAGWLASLMRQATDLVLPKPLQASSYLFVGGVGGLVGTFSPFGVIGINLGGAGGLGGTSGTWTPPALSPANPSPNAAPPQNPPLPPNYYQGAVGTTSTTGLPSVTITTTYFNAPVPGVAVTFTTGASQSYDPDSEAKVCDAQGNVPASGSVQVLTDLSGVATLPCLSFGTKAGFANLSATFDPTSLNFPGSDQLTVNGSFGSSLNWLVESQPGLPAQLVFVQAPSATAAAGVPLAQQPSVQLLDGLGNEVYTAGVGVTVSVTAGGGTATYTAPVATDANGVAAFSDLAVGGQVAGVGQTLSFSFTGISTPLTSSLAITAGPASQLVVTTQPSATAQAGVAFGTQPVASIQDQYGNVVNSTAAVVAGLASGGASLAGTTSVNAVGGVATFTDLRIDGLIGDRTLEFTSGSLTSAPTSTISVAAGSAAQLAISTQPSATAKAGEAFSTQPAVTIKDAWGNVVNSTAAVVASLASGGAALAGTTSVNAVGGVATFTDLRIDGLIGDRTLQFASGGLTSPASNSISVSAGAANAIKTYMGAPPAAAQSYDYGINLTAYVAVSPAPQVIVTDAFGNPVGNQTVYWAATSSNFGVLTVGGTGTPTGAGGTAQVTSWVLGDGLNQATASLFAPGVTPTIPGYSNAQFSAATPTGISVFACAQPPTSKTALGPMSIPAPKGTIKSVTIQMSITGTSDALSDYDATLVAYLEGTGTPLGSTTGKVQLPGDNGKPVPVTFSFAAPIVKQAGNSTIRFDLSVSAPANRKPQVWYTSAKLKSNDPCYSSLVYDPASPSVFQRGLWIDVTN